MNSINDYSYNWFINRNLKISTTWVSWIKKIQFYYLIYNWFFSISFLIVWFHKNHSINSKKKMFILIVSQNMISLCSVVSSFSFYRINLNINIKIIITRWKTSLSSILFNIILLYNNVLKQRLNNVFSWVFQCKNDRL